MESKVKPVMSANEKSGFCVSKMNIFLENVVVKKVWREIMEK
jgi:hypothetical protein